MLMEEGGIGACPPSHQKVTPEHLHVQINEQLPACWLLAAPLKVIYTRDLWPCLNGLSEALISSG